MNISQTALGLQLRNLEMTLGVELLVRHSRGITVTKAGELLYRRGIGILRLVDETKNELAALAGPGREHVVLGLTPSIMRLVGADSMVNFKAELPDLSISLVEQMSFVLRDILMRDEVDLALLYDLAEGTGSLRLPLAEERLLFITANDSSFPSGPVQFKDAIASSLALASDRDHIWRAVHRAAATFPLPVNISFDVQSLDTIKTLVARGLATSIVPYGAFGEDIESGAVQAHTIEAPAIKRTLFLVGSPNRRALRQEAELLGFIDRMVDTLVSRSPHAAIIGRCASDRAP
ncbi:LysR family nitrogen assimilation transcriptional regulator [Ancylobacter polymorphus]|uniref:LysR family nitrogen assimilation transcriptional regulator n=1 Tax=Ancylobacter polymorphus TaxID=223390 RepID=A0ABU0BGH3_9HYPH|nr:LysR family nitrogen assimilation transcriptional regulator [Ancylobacter polymorphus]